MTIRLAGVATGVRNDAAADTATAISAGLAETFMSAAAEMAIGITVSAVAIGRRGSGYPGEEIDGIATSAARSDRSPGIRPDTESAIGTSWITAPPSSVARPIVRRDPCQTAIIRSG